ncbi:MAG: hypothetical protein ACRCWI_02135, partial [Brevinema sp.]
ETKTLFLFSVFLILLLILAPTFSQQTLAETQTSVSISVQKRPIFDADYNSGQELILIEREPVDYDETKIGGLQPYPMTMKLYSIYWNPSNNQYYYVKDGSDLIQTNGLTYKLDPKKEEQTLAKISLDNELVYAGYISTNERLYINPKTKKQFIKTLSPIKDEVVFTPSFYKSPKRGWISISYSGSDGLGRSRDRKNGTIEYYDDAL